MRIHDLKRDGIGVWPPRTGSSFGPGDIFGGAGVGILKIVRRTGNRLLRIIEWKGREVIGPLECDAPPILEELETLLRAQAGKTIKAIGDMEV